MAGDPFQGVSFDGLDTIEAVDGVIKTLYIRRNTADFLLRGGMAVALRVLRRSVALDRELEKIATDENALALTIDKLKAKRFRLAHTCKLCDAICGERVRVVPALKTESFSTFTEADRCHHWYCKPCIRKYVKVNEAKLVIDCPECDAVMPEFHVRELLGSKRSTRRTIMMERAAPHGVPARSGAKMCPGCFAPVVKIDGCNNVTCRCGTRMLWSTGEKRDARRITTTASVTPPAFHPPGRPDRFTPPLQTRHVWRWRKNHIQHAFDRRAIYTAWFVRLISISTDNAHQGATLFRFIWPDTIEQVFCFGQETREMAVYRTKLSIGAPLPVKDAVVKKNGTTIVFVNAAAVDAFLDNTVDWFTPHLWRVVLFGGGISAAVGKLIDGVGRAQIGAAKFEFRAATSENVSTMV